jgi:protein SYS1
MFYGAMVWDPWLIVSQIVCLQCLYYLTLGVLMSLLVGTRVPRLTLLYLFDFATLTPRTPTGWCVIASFLLAAVAGYARRSSCHLPFLFFAFASPSWLVQSSDTKPTV